MASYSARLLIWAFTANSAGGGKSRFSRRVESRFVLTSTVATHQPPLFVFQGEGIVSNSQPANRALIGSMTLEDARTCFPNIQDSDQRASSFVSVSSDQQGTFSAAGGLTNRGKTTETAMI